MGALDDITEDLEKRYREAVKQAGWEPGQPELAKSPRGGRPRGERRVMISMTVDPMAARILDDISERYHTPRGRIFDRLLFGMHRSEDEEQEDERPRRAKR